MAGKLSVDPAGADESHASPETDNLYVIRMLMTAFNERDVGSVLSLMDPAVEFFALRRQHLRSGGKPCTAATTG
jgi:hypothetical protein